jgi:hypothetical protein
LSSIIFEINGFGTLGYFDQIEFFVAGETLDGGFADKGRGAGRPLFTIDQADRAAVFGITAAVAGVMGPDAALEVRGYAGIQFIIFASDNVDVPGDGARFLSHTR